MQFDIKNIKNGIASNEFYGKTLTLERETAGYTYGAYYSEKSFGETLDSNIFIFNTKGINTENKSSYIKGHIYFRNSTHNHCIDIFCSNEDAYLSCPTTFDAEIIEINIGENTYRALYLKDCKGTHKISFTGEYFCVGTLPSAYDTVRTDENVKLIEKSIQQKLADEISNREAAITSLNTDFSKEIKDAVDAEAKSRKDADDALQEAINNIHSFEYRIVDALPALEDAQTNVVYLTKRPYDLDDDGETDADSATTSFNDYYTEYIKVQIGSTKATDEETGEEIDVPTYKFESIGTTQTEMANYVQIKKFNTTVSNLEKADEDEAKARADADEALQSAVDALEGSTLVADQKNITLESPEVALGETNNHKVITLSEDITVSTIKANQFKGNGHSDEVTCSYISIKNLSGTINIIGTSGSNVGSLTLDIFNGKLASASFVNSNTLFSKITDGNTDNDVRIYVNDSSLPIAYSWYIISGNTEDAQISFDSSL